MKVEPSTLLAPRPEQYDALAAAAAERLSIVVEVTERSIVDDPAALISALGEIRAAGMGVAIDDLGAVCDSLALLLFVAPDVTKLDLRLVQARTDPDVASVALIRHSCSAHTSVKVGCSVAPDLSLKQPGRPGVATTTASCKRSRILRPNAQLLEISLHVRGCGAEE